MSWKEDASSYMNGQRIVTHCRFFFVLSWVRIEGDVSFDEAKGASHHPLESMPACRNACDLLEWIGHWIRSLMYSFGQASILSALCIGKSQ